MLFQMSREEDVLAQAKKVMDDFFVALQEAKVTAEEFGLERKQQTRIPSPVQNPDFKNKILSNAPHKNQDYIIAEKKNW